MNWAHVHLIINHIPVIGIGLLILLFIVAMVRKNKGLITVALAFIILISLATIPVYLTGEPAEEVVEDMPGISEELIEEHEEQADIAFILVEVAGGLALITLIARRYSDKLGQRLGNGKSIQQNVRSQNCGDHKRRDDQRGHDYSDERNVSRCAFDIKNRQGNNISPSWALVVYRKPRH